VREPWFSGDDPYWLKEVLLSGGTLKTRERVWCVGLRSCGASSPWKRGEKCGKTTKARTVTGAEKNCRRSATVPSTATPPKRSLLRGVAEVAFLADQSNQELVHSTPPIRGIYVVSEKNMKTPPSGSALEFTRRSGICSERCFGFMHTDMALVIPLEEHALPIILAGIFLVSAGDMFETQDQYFHQVGPLRPSNSGGTRPLWETHVYPCSVFRTRSSV